MKFCRVALIVLLTLGVSGVASADANDILSAHFEAVGGFNTLSAIKSVKRYGDANMSGSFGKLSGSIEQAVVVGKKSFSKMDMDAYAETTVWDGTTGWKSTTTEGTKTLSGPELVGPKAARYLDPLQEIYELYGPMAFVQVKGETIRGKKTVGLQIVKTFVVYYIDKESNHLVALKTTTDTGDEQLAVYYSEYNKYGGVAFPDSVELDIGNGALMIEYHFSKTETDVSLDDKIFRKP